MPRTQYLPALLSATAFCAALSPALPTFAANTVATTPPTDFTQIDTNADGVINFSEFAAFAASQDITRTQAAQTFIDLANGDVLITKSEYMLGVRVSESSTWKQGYDPAAISTQDALTETEDEPTPVRGRILDITPNEEVAGEVIRSFEDDPFVIDALDDDVVENDTMPSDGI